MLGIDLSVVGVAARGRGPHLGMRAREFGSDTIVASGSVFHPLVTITGSLSASESGSDILTASGTVVDPSATISGSLSTSETGSDTITSSGTVAAPATSETWVITGHSITDAWTIKAGSGNNGTEDMADADGITYTETLQSGPYSSASYRYANRTTLGGINLQTALNSGGDYLVGIEAMNDTTGLDSYVDDFGSPPADAYGGALDWHEAAQTGGFSEHFYVRWYGANTSHGGFNQAWRDEISDVAWDQWDGIKTYVDANKSGSLPFSWVYLDAAFAVLFDRIQAGTYTEFAIGDFFSDNVHPDTNLGHWLSAVFVWCSIRGTDPNTYGLQLGGMSGAITSAQKAELVDLIRDVVADPTLALVTSTISGSLSASESGSDTIVASGSIVGNISGSLSTSESGSDTIAASGTVSTPAASDTPSTILGANIIEWLDPQDTATMFNTITGTGSISSDGDLVGRIVGQESSTNFDATANSAARPIYRTANGGYLEGTDGNSNILAASLSSSGPFYLAMRVRIRSTPGGNEKMATLHSTAGGLWWQGSNVSFIISGLLFTQDGGGPATVFTENQWYTVEYIYDTDNRTVSLDGTDTTNTDTYAPPTTTLVSLLAEPGGDGPNMDLGRFVLGSAVPTSTQRTDIRTWLEA